MVASPPSPDIGDGRSTLCGPESDEMPAFTCPSSAPSAETQARSGPTELETKEPLDFEPESGSWSFSPAPSTPPGALAPSPALVTQPQSQVPAPVSPVPISPGSLVHDLLHQVMGWSRSRWLLPTAALFLLAALPGYLGRIPERTSGFGEDPFLRPAAQSEGSSRETAAEPPYDAAAYEAQPELEALEVGRAGCDPSRALCLPRR